MKLFLQWKYYGKKRLFYLPCSIQIKSVSALKIFSFSRNLSNFAQYIHTLPNLTFMLRNYFKIAFRNFGQFCGGATHQRNWGTQSNGCQCD
jgi:hypothetical protein